MDIGPSDHPATDAYPPLQPLSPEWRPRDTAAGAFRVLAETLGAALSILLLFLAILGPLISTPAPAGWLKLVILTYPALMLLTAVTVSFWPLGGFGVSMLLTAGALTCCVGLATGFEDSAGEFWARVRFVLVAASPAFLMTILTGLAWRLGRDVE